LKRDPYDVVLATHEQGFLLARVRNEIQELAGLALPEFSTINQMQGKADFVRTLDELNLPYPQTSIVRTRAQLQQTQKFPCFVKLAHSTAGMGVFRVADSSELDIVTRRLESEGRLDGETEILVQQTGLGKLSIVQSVFQHGKLVGTHCAQARVQGVGGAPMARESVWHPHVIEDIRKLGQHLNWHGALFIEYFHDADSNEVEYMEANPRIGETFNATRCGVNLCEQLVRVSLGEEVPPLPPGEIGIRTHQSFMIAMSAATKGLNRRQLVTDLYDACTSTNDFHDSEDELTRWKDDLPSVIPAAAVVLQLLLSPRSASRIVEKTVANYSLPESAASVIRELSIDELRKCFD